MKKRRTRQARPLTITRVAFRSNVSIGSFQNVHVEAEAVVRPGQDPDAVLDQLESYVAGRLRLAKDGRPVTVHPPVVGRFKDRLDRP
jgi:hypothetical protein